MMFIVTYRDKTGKVRNERIEATGRAECLATLKARGITPIRVERRNGGGASCQSVQDGEVRAARPRAVIISALLILVGLGGVWWWTARTETMPRSTGDSKVGAPRQNVPQDGGGGVFPQGKTRAEVESRLPKAPDEGMTLTQEGTSHKLPPKQEIPVAETNYIASRYTTNSAVRPLDPKDPDLPIKTGVYQEIGSLMSGELGDPVPPFPYSFQVEGSGDQTDEFIASLKHKVVIRPQDGESTMDMKRRTLEARLDLLDAIDQGMSVKDAIKEAYVQRVRAYEARQAYIEGLQEYAAENPPKKDFEDVLLDVNSKLRAKGIKVITKDCLGLEEVE